MKKVQKALTAQETQTAFGQRVRTYRDAHGWTQAELAKQLADAGWAVHKSGIAKIELAQRPVTISELLTLANVLQVHPGDLLPSAPRVDTTVLELRRVERAIVDLRAERDDLHEQIRRLDERERDLAAEHRAIRAKMTAAVVDGDNERVETLLETYTLDDDDVVSDT